MVLPFILQINKLLAVKCFTDSIKLVKHFSFPLLVIYRLFELQVEFKTVRTDERDVSVV